MRRLRSVFMPSNNLMIKDGQVIENTWALLTEAGATALAGECIIPLASFMADSDALKARGDVGVFLENDADLPAVAEHLTGLPVIAINFPGFMDGRGFSLARLLRERFGYQGEIRAVGHIIRDQLTYLKRCGFTSFCFNDDVDVEAAVASLNDFTEAYQTSVDFKEPLFRRRA